MMCLVMVLNDSVEIVDLWSIISKLNKEKKLYFDIS